MLFILDSFILWFDDFVMRFDDFIGRLDDFVKRLDLFVKRLDDFIRRLDLFIIDFDPFIICLDLFIGGCVAFLRWRGLWQSGPGGLFNGVDCVILCPDVFPQGCEAFLMGNVYYPGRLFFVFVFSDFEEGAVDGGGGEVVFEGEFFAGEAVDVEDGAVGGVCVGGGEYVGAGVGGGGGVLGDSEEEL